MTQSRIKAVRGAAAVLLCLIAMLTGGDAFAVVEVTFVGLHGKRANMRIERRNVLLAPGESKHGVRLLSVTRQEAVVRMLARNFLFRRGDKDGILLPNEMTIERSPGGMFLVRGAVDGKRLDFIVDTGASHVVLSRTEAARLRLKYSRTNRIQISTASRTETAYEVTLDSVSIGGIVLSRVPAIVTRGKAPSVALLGMSFLARLEIYQDAEHMYLRQ